MRALFRTIFFTGLGSEGVNRLTVKVSCTVKSFLGQKLAYIKRVIALTVTKILGQLDYSYIKRMVTMILGHMQSSLKLEGAVTVTYIISGKT